MDVALFLLLDLLEKLLFGSSLLHFFPTIHALPKEPILYVQHILFEMEELPEEVMRIPLADCAYKRVVYIPCLFNPKEKKGRPEGLP